MRERHVRRIKRIHEFRYRKGGFEEKGVEATNSPEWMVREILVESVHDVAMLHHFSGRIAEAKKEGKPELAEHMRKWRENVREKLALKKKIIEELAPEKIGRFVEEAEKAGMSREELIELSPPFLRKRILELK